MGISNTVFGLTIYFTVLFIMVSLFSIAGVFSNNDLVTDPRFSTAVSSSINSSVDSISVTTPNSAFKDVFSFFFWNISFYNNTILMSYLWLFRIIFVYLPALWLMLSFYYSLPTVNG